MKKGILFVLLTILVFVLRYFYEPIKRGVRLLTAGKVTEHFRWAEFDSRDGVSVPEEYLGNIQQLAENLEVIRRALGSKPITILSGYRTQEHNYKVGGVINSKHLTGEAADIRVKGVSPKAVYHTILALMDSGKIVKGGVGLYSTFVHYDIRGEKVTWQKV